jgi:hypothetical protein
MLDGSSHELRDDVLYFELWKGMLDTRDGMKIHSIGGLCRGSSAQTRINRASYEIALATEGRLVKRLLFFLSQNTDKRTAALRAPDRIRFINERAGEGGWRNDM